MKHEVGRREKHGWKTTQKKLGILDDLVLILQHVGGEGTISPSWYWHDSWRHSNFAYILSFQNTPTCHKVWISKNKNLVWKLKAQVYWFLIWLRVVQSSFQVMCQLSSDSQINVSQIRLEIAKITWKIFFPKPLGMLKPLPKSKPLNPSQLPPLNGLHCHIFVYFCC